MSAVRTRKSGMRSSFLTKREEEILRAIHFYRYMTVVDVTKLLFSSGSRTWVGGILSRLAGDADYQTNQYLYRFRLPSATAGNREMIFTLGSRGRDYLAQEMGLPVEWYFRPGKVKHMGYGQVVHNLILTRFLVAAHSWSARQPDFKLVKTRISYELARAPVTVRVAGWGRTEAIPVIPDAWLLFEQMEEGTLEQAFPILLEIDRGTAQQQKFKQQVAARIEYIRSGAYKRLFGYQSVVIAYATTGATPEYRETRLATMRAWTREVLTQLRMENWASVFRFHSLSLTDIYTTGLFEGPVWYRPDAASPLPLFG